jgi:hypothetical protein
MNEEKTDDILKLAVLSPIKSLQQQQQKTVVIFGQNIIFI